MICSVTYVGENFVVELIKNHEQREHETPDLKLVREAAEKYADDLQDALNRCLHVGTTEKFSADSIFYIAMCYGYPDDPCAKIVTIVDKEYKQHIFVVPDNLQNIAIQISDGDLEVNSLMSYRYLVSQSVIDILIMKKY